MEKFMFNHKSAQKYEFNSARVAILNDFDTVYQKWEECKKYGGLWQDDSNQWFQGDSIAWNEFVEHVRNKKCLEIGSGPFGFLSFCYWIKDRVIIDPLIDEYKNFQKGCFDKTFFTDDIKTYSKNSELLIEDLVGKVDGAIICRNALDHCDNPFEVLDNVAKYATKGCYFLLWTDIWHLGPLDEGHRNITNSSEDLDRKMIELGFKILKYGQKIRNPNEFVEYGRLFIKG